MRNLLIWQRLQISLRCLWRHLIHCWIRYINLFITSWYEDQNDCCVNASLVLFSPQSVLLILHLGSTSQWLVMLYVTLYGVPWLMGGIFNGHTLLREWFQRQFNCRFQLCILLGRYWWVNSCLGFNSSLSSLEAELLGHSLTIHPCLLHLVQFLPHPPLDSIEISSSGVQ